MQSMTYAFLLKESNVEMIRIKEKLGSIVKAGQFKVVTLKSKHNYASQIQRLGVGGIDKLRHIKHFVVTVCENFQNVHNFQIDYQLQLVATEKCTKRIEYILEGNLLEKSVKRPFCCTVSILQVYFTYLCYTTFWALEYHFKEKLKLMLKEIRIMKQAGFIIDQ